MKYMEYTTTNENTLTVGFRFKNKITGADTMFDYEVPFEAFIESVKNYFDKYFDVVLEGKDKDVWNMLVDLGEKVDVDIIQTFIDDEEIIKDLTNKLEKDAHEKFDEMCEEEAEDDKLDESYEDDEDVEDEDDYYGEDEKFEYPDPSEIYAFRVYFIDEDGDEIAAVDDLVGYDFEANYETKEEALDAMKRIIEDPKVKEDSEIAGCHSVIVPLGGYDPDDGPEAQDIWETMVSEYDPYELVDEVWKPKN